MASGAKLADVPARIWHRVQDGTVLWQPPGERVGPWFPYVRADLHEAVKWALVETIAELSRVLSVLGSPSGNPRTAVSVIRNRGYEVIERARAAVGVLEKEESGG